MNKREYDALLRTDLYHFTQRVFEELHPDTPFSGSKHIEVIAARLEASIQGKSKRLIINVPPRSLKSISVSVALSAFLLGHWPSTKIMAISYSQDLSDKHSRDVRQVMNSEWYKALFPTRLSPNKQKANELETTAGGVRLATSLGGSVTGRGANWIIIDDPTKPLEAISETLRNNANESFGHTVASRLNDKENGRIIVIMQRLHEEDFTGYLLALGGWEHLSFPAIAEEDEIFEYDNLLGRQRFVRKCGDALHPARESLEKLQELRRDLGEYDFAAQYQQRPSPMGGGMVKEEMFRYYDSLDGLDFEYKFQSWDTANKSGQLNDFSVCTTWGAKGDNAYLLNVFRARLDYPQLKEAVREQRRLFWANHIIIEDKSSGMSLIQELQQEGFSGLVPYKSQLDKVTRLYTQIAAFSAGSVYFPRSAGWLPVYVHELKIFPKGKFDDQVDSTSQALEWFRSQVMPNALLYQKLIREGKLPNPYR